MESSRSSDIPAVHMCNFENISVAVEIIGVSMGEPHTSELVRVES